MITKIKKMISKFFKTLNDEDYCNVAWIEIGKYIKKFRKKRGFLQHELADTINISKSCISRLERGVVPLSDKMAKKIGKCLKINLVNKRKTLE